MVEIVAEQLDLDKIARDTVYERSALLHILPSQIITSDELTQDDECNKPHKSFEVERNRYTQTIHVLFDRIVTPRFRMSNDHFHKCGQADLMVDAARDTAGELDSKFAHAVDMATIAPGKTVPETDKIQWLQVDDTLNNDSFAQALKNIRQLFEPKFMFVGMPLVADMLRLCGEVIPTNLPLEFEIAGLVCRIADRDRSIAPKALYFFGESAQFGRTYTLQDVKVHLSQSADEIEYVIDMVMGSVIFGVSLVARVDFIGPV